MAAVTVEHVAELLASGEIRLVAVGPQGRAEQSRLGNRPGQGNDGAILDGTRDELPGELRRAADAMAKLRGRGSMASSHISGQRAGMAERDVGDPDSEPERDDGMRGFVIKARECMRGTVLRLLRRRLARKFDAVWEAGSMA